MSFKYRYRKQIFLTVIILIIITIVTIPIAKNLRKTKKDKNDKNIVQEKILISKKEEKKEVNHEELIKVDIKGEIINPGIYSMEKNSRVIDVIEKAGGLTENANTTVNNLSKKLSDEMVIIIYSNSQVQEFSKTKEIEKQVQEYCVKKDENAIMNDSCIEDKTNTSLKISINRATLQELTNLPGIGESKANDILTYRNEHGEFKTIDELKNISGIGESIFAKIKDYITL